MLFKILSSFAILATVAKASCLHGTTLMRRSLSENGTSETDFDYSGQKGPLNWANLDSSYQLCATGINQSPINIDSNIPKLIKPPTFKYLNVKSAKVENIGSTIETVVNGSMLIDNTMFNLMQFHFHTPSEHRINGEFYPLEMHMIHQSLNYSIAVISVLFELHSSETTDLLTSVTKNLKDITKSDEHTESGPLDFTPLIKHLNTSPLFTYSGSLTTPPCSENVKFIIAKKPLSVNVTTFNALKKVMKFNSRYTQNNLGQPNLLSPNLHH